MKHRIVILYVATIVAVGGFFHLDTVSQVNDARSSARENDAAHVVSQRAGCERGNEFRKVSNARVANINDLKNVTSDFLASARVARLDSGDLHVAHQYGALAEKLSKIDPKSSPLTDCVAAYPLDR